ncbi:MAG TPA: right-handed parallel beta-helix repeat-containing protein, partial [Burkholderiales bacterium]|nr:right-handed parallel beta-helix repeat-containing protein [Burkholderiales bacterium]
GGAALVAALHLRFKILDYPPQEPAPVVAPHRTLVVGGEYAAIGDALAQAKPGDIVEVQAGEYREQVRMREGVQLRSRAPLAAILRAPAEGKGPAVIAESVHHGRITGFRIVADEKVPLATGILLDGADIEVSDCGIEGTAVGIEIRGGHPVLRANTIQDSTQNAITISGDATPWISHNAFLRNGRKGRKPAVAATDPARPTLLGNTFDDTAARAVTLAGGSDAPAVSKFNFFLTGQRVRP